MSSESRLYGDVLGCRRALNAAILEDPVPAFAELDYPASLPNAARLLATDRSAELSALREAHDGKLPDAVGVTRRWLWESRLSGQLSDERNALELFGDVLQAAGFPVAAGSGLVQKLRICCLDICRRGIRGQACISERAGEPGPEDYVGTRLACGVPP